MKKISSEKLRQAMRLYAVSDEAWLEGRTLAEITEQAIEGGATFVQLRDKGPRSCHAHTVEQAKALLPVCRRFGVPFVIDDDVEAALEVGADGVHVGQSDVACETARQALGPDAIVGVSAQTVEQALRAQEVGADYLGVGAVIPTPTKTDAEIVSFETLQAIVDAVDIPVVAIGGLNEKTVDAIAGSGVDGVAVVSAIYAATDPKGAAQRLVGKLEGCLTRAEPISSDEGRR